MRQIQAAARVHGGALDFCRRMCIRAWIRHDFAMVINYTFSSACTQNVPLVCRQQHSHPAMPRGPAS